MKPEDITKKEPFKRIKPRAQEGGAVSVGEKLDVRLPDNLYTPISQETFLTEFYPSGHRINAKPAKQLYEKDGTTPKGAPQPVAKIAVPMQKMIATKQRIHLATNDLAFTLTELEITEEKEKYFHIIKQTWKERNCQVGLSKSIGSWLETADTALYFYRDEQGKIRWKDFGFENGDILLPHYDSLGNMVYFGRMYAGVGKDGKQETRLDVIDKDYVTSYVQRGRWGSILSTSKWKKDGKPEVHGFSQIPICYKRSDDVCWGPEQALIDSFEEAISNMAENNRYYANAILFVKGSIANVPGRDDAGKMLQGQGDDADAKFLATPESNEAQMNEIKLLQEQIFMGSFTVNVSPDTVKSSGDLPGITVKLLFSPAIEKALDAKKELDSFVDKAVSLFKEGLGLELGKKIGIGDLKCMGEIDVWIPQNEEEFNRMINDAVYAKVLSRETGAEKNTIAVNGEKERVKSEVAAENAGSLTL